MLAMPSRGTSNFSSTSAASAASAYRTRTPRDSHCYLEALSVNYSSMFLARGVPAVPAQGIMITTSVNALQVNGATASQPENVSGVIMFYEGLLV